jgi:predicted glycosyl hydrolase (DUF1957 family)
MPTITWKYLQDELHLRDRLRQERREDMLAAANAWLFWMTVCGAILFSASGW